jgi:hypothetical protein
MPRSPHRRARRLTLSLLFIVLAFPTLLGAQTSLEIRDRLAGHFNIAMSKFIALAEAMPEEAYTWSPREGTMEVGQVFMHVARYHYLYPSENMDMPPPWSR